MANDRQRLASLHGVGSVANTLIPKLAGASDALGVHDLLLAMGRAEFNLGSNADLQPETPDDPLAFVRFKDQGLVTTTLLIDNRSPLVLSRSHLALAAGREYQDQLFAVALASLLAAQCHFRNQKGFADLMAALG